MKSHRPSSKNADGVDLAGVHFFGDWELSDVTIVVGSAHFKCHKILLADSSPYFYAKFFAFRGLQKYENKVWIGANAVVFYHLMEIIYTGQLSGWKGLLNCMTTAERVEYKSRWGRNPDAWVLWKRYSKILKMAEKFGVLGSAVLALEKYFLRTCDYGEHGDDCGCGVKLIIAVMYGMEEYKAASTATRNAVTHAMSVMSKLMPTVVLDPFHFEWLLQRQ